MYYVRNRLRKRMRKRLRETVTYNMPTINDVAEKAGVSITTVSYVITGKRFVSEDLQNRVRQAMEKVGYRPNNLARSLRLGKTDTIGLIIPDNSNLFFAEISRYIEDIGFANGYTVFLCNSDDNAIKQSKYLDVLIAKQVDGIIFISVRNEKSDLKMLTEANIPFVIVDRDDGTDADVVLVDNFSGGYEAVSYLLSLGHTEIGCISGPATLAASEERVNGGFKALVDNNLKIRQEFIVRGDFRFKSGEAAMDKLLNLPVPPTAVFVCNDMMAIGAIRSVHNRNLRVPDDISIIGFDNPPIAEVINPALTTIAQPISEIAASAMNILLKRIKDEKDKPSAKIILTPKLIERNSCQPFTGKSK